MTPDLFALGGCGADEMSRVLKLLGYRQSEKEGVLYFKLRPLHSLLGPLNSKSSKLKKSSGIVKKSCTPKKQIANYNPDSPFAVLRNLEIPH